MRDYQRKRNNKYILPNAVYNQTLWLIRDYYRMAEEVYDQIGLSGVASDGMPHGSSTSDPTARKAENIADSYEGRMIGIIEESLRLIPEEYRRGVWESIQWRKAFPLDADRTTYARHKSKFIWLVAEKVGMLQHRGKN